MSVTREARLLPSVNQLVQEQVAAYAQTPTFEVRNHIPDTGDIPGSGKPRHWLRVEDVICVFVDMKGSTQLSATIHESGTAAIYDLFTGTAVRLFHQFDPAYIDVRGDGVFALFDKGQEYRALAAAVTFKTFAAQNFAMAVRDKTGLNLSAHIGIDQDTVLVRKVGLKPYRKRTDRQNEVWAGKPINMASKLAALGEADELLASDRYFARITHDLVRWSCGCQNGSPTTNRNLLWEARDLTHDARFDFNTAHRLQTQWCFTHGWDYCDRILALDK